MRVLFIYPNVNAQVGFNYGIAYISAFTIIVLYIAAKIFTTERVITGRLFSRRLRSRD